MGREAVVNRMVWIEERYYVALPDDYADASVTNYHVKFDQIESATALYRRWITGGPE